MTHSQEEALSIADVVGVMKDGSLQQMGAPEELYAYPRNRFVAGFVGLANYLDARILGVNGSTVRVELPGGAQCQFVARDQDTVPADGRGSVTIAVRPENIHLSPASTQQVGRSGGEGAVTLRGTITSSIFSGNLIDYFIKVSAIEPMLRARLAPPRIANPGEEVDLVIPQDQLIPLED